MNTLSPHISDAAARALLGLVDATPVRPAELAASLRVSFFPRAAAGPRLRAFGERLQAALRRWGVELLPYDLAPSGEPGARIVLITLGEARDGDLAIDHVRHLRFTTLVTVLDGPSPADRAGGMQARLDAIVADLAWHCAQTTLFVEEDRWTLCTMNGALVRFEGARDFDRDVLEVLVPKLAAPVVPPHAADFALRDGALDPEEPAVAAALADLHASASPWAKTGLLLYHTPIASLRFRSRFYQRIVTAYLDHRTGMSYGFLARQLPTRVQPALTLGEAGRRYGELDWEGLPAPEGQRLVRLKLGGTWIVPVPEVRVLTTRSGCDKAHLDPRRDAVVLGQQGVQITLETPVGVVDAKPSYDTRTILANAVANGLVANVLARRSPGAPWAEALARSGAAQVHWHGTLRARGLPAGMILHGEENPPVSCSTAQSALFALAGKLGALASADAQGVAFVGDVHIEPLHGVNVSGGSLVGLAGLITERQADDGVIAFEEQEPPAQPGAG